MIPPSPLTPQSRTGKVSSIGLDHQQALQVDIHHHFRLALPHSRTDQTERPFIIWLRPPSVPCIEYGSRDNGMTGCLTRHLSTGLALGALPILICIAVASRSLGPSGSFRWLDRDMQADPSVKAATWTRRPVERAAAASKSRWERHGHSEKRTTQLVPGTAGNSPCGKSRGGLRRLDGACVCVSGHAFRWHVISRILFGPRSNLGPFVPLSVQHEILGE